MHDMNLILERANLRADFLQKRLNFSNTREYQILSFKICQKIQNYLNALFHDNLKNKIIAYYFPFRGEVDISQLFKINVFSSRIAFPKIVNNDIKFYEIKTLDDLIEGSFKIMEPDENLEEVVPDIILTPGIVFNHRTKHRLGYGQGHYDRFFQKSTLSDKKILKIGVCFDFQLFDFKHWEYDFMLDIIITDKLIFNMDPKLIKQEIDFLHN